MFMQTSPWTRNRLPAMWRALAADLAFGPVRCNGNFSMQTSMSWILFFCAGKRLNMKKVISYVASNFRQDKIWQRRTKPDARKYQVVLAIDETRSMRVRAFFVACSFCLTFEIFQML